MIMSVTLRQALTFLVDTIFDIYAFILIIRLILAFVQADYYHPLTQFVVKASSFIIKPLRRFIPNWHDIEFSTLVVIFILECIKYAIIAFLLTPYHHIVGIPILAIANMLKLIINTFFYGILLQAILSWVQPQSPANQLLLQFNSPIMRPLQRIIPPIGGIDISAIPALIILQLLLVVVVQPMTFFGLGLTIG
jgi:YggT family protein